MKTVICIPLHPSGGKFKDNNELRYALRSLEKNFTDEFEVVIISQKLPDWIQGVKHVYGEGLKSSLRKAAQEYPEGFFWWYDDNCLLRPTDAETMRVTPGANRWSKPQTEWRRQLERVRKRLVDEGYAVTDYSSPHGPYWFDQEMVEEGFSDWKKVSGKFPLETWILSKRKWPHTKGETRQYYGDFKLAPGPNHRYLNYNDRGNTPELRLFLKFQFPNLSRFERFEVEPEKALRPLCFIHVPKTAGTSISKALGSHLRVSIDGHKTSHFPVNHPDVQKRIANGASPVAVVRNPYDRAWSLYKFFHKHKESRPRLDMLAEAFISRVGVEEFWCHADIRSISKVLPHFKTQSSFIDRSVEILRFETLDEDWSLFCATVGREGLELPRLQVSEGIPWQEALSETTKAAIAGIYDEDFRNFGYPK